MRVKMSRRARWAVPGTAVAVTRRVVAALQIPAAQASPDLPDKTPAQLLASLSSDSKVPPLTGTVVETTSLGLPQLPQIASSASSITVAAHRLAHGEGVLPGLEPLPAGDPAARVGDRRHRGRLQAVALAVHAGLGHRVRSVRGRRAKHAVPEAPPGAGSPRSRPRTRCSTKVGKTTLVSVQANVMVAGEPAYQLVLAPKDHRSLVGKIVIARRRQVRRAAARPGLRQGRHLAGVPGRLHGPAVRRAGPGQLRLHPAARRVKVRRGEARRGDSGKSVAEVRAVETLSGFGSYGKSWLTVVSFPQADLTRHWHPGAAAAPGSSAAPASSRTSTRRTAARSASPRRRC